ncbi:MAG: hypothetical protein ACE5I1_06095, partial [bacterium]
YLILSHKKKPEFVRMSYSSGTWVLDSGFPQKLKKFKNDKKNPLSLVHANDGGLWVFAYYKKTLLARHSADGGMTWSGNITIKSGLTTKAGIADGVAFMAIPYGGTTAEGHVGIAYGEKSDDNSRFGFLVHRDSDPETTWRDESASLSSTGSERATNELNATTDNTGQVYLLTQNTGAKGSDPANTLFKRATDGSWQSFIVNDDNSGVNWFSPGVVVDDGNSTLYLMGINKNTGQGEYKTSSFGQENTLMAATATNLFATGNGSGDNFVDISVPAAANIGSAAELFVCADNKDANDIWYNKIALQPVGDAKPPITVQSVTLAPNEANTHAAYTISLALGDEGALSAGNGTMTLQFPNNTLVPGGIAANQIAVNGTLVSTATSNSSTRKIVITTPVNLNNNDNVNITFSTTAGLLNPSEAGNFELIAWTSEQLTPATSPSFAISTVATNVSAATVTPSPTTTGSASAYTIDFNLGANGRLASGISTITITFDSETTVSDGSISGAQVNGANANATGDNASKSIILTAPSSTGFSNGGAVSINLPASAIVNPSSEGDHTLTVATSVEPTPVTSNTFSLDEPPPSDTTGDDNPIPGSGGDFDKPNQNRPFYHGGFWWVAAKKASDGDWYLWKLIGNTWSAEMEIDAKGSNRPDCIVDSPSNTLYIFMAASSSSSTRFLRLTYSGGSWSIDSGFPVSISSFRFSGDNTSVLTRAKNGDLWIFNYNGSQTLEQQRPELVFECYCKKRRRQRRPARRSIVYQQWEKLRRRGIWRKHCKRFGIRFCHT